MNDIIPVTPEEGLPPLNPNPQELSRLTVVLNIHHEQAQDQPRSLSLPYAELLQTQHESYSRRCKASSEWTSVDLGWVPAEDVGFIVIEHLEGKRFTTHPTEAEKAIVAGRILEIAYATSLNDTWPVPPRLPFFAATERAQDLRIRCRSGEAHYRIHIIPR